MAWLPTLWNNNDSNLLPFTNLRREFNDLFDRFTGEFPSVEWNNGNSNASFMPRMNMVETDETMEITAELPGLTSKDVDVSLSGDILTVRGQREESLDTERKNYRLVESRYGAFSRSVRLPFTAQATDVTATCRDGILTVTVNKPADMKAKTQKIAVK